MTNFHGPAFDPHQPEEGRTVTAPRRTAQFEHIRGPYDGEFSPVAVDDDGVPVPFYLLGGMTFADLSRNPTTEFVSDPTTQLYERDVKITADGPRYVFVFRGEEIHRAA